MEIGNYQGREVGLGGGCLSQCVRAKKNFWGPGKFCRLLWDQGFEYVTRTGSWKKLLGHQKVLSAFVGPGVRICDGDRIVEKTFGAPESFVMFCRLSWDQGFEYVTGTGSWKKTFGAPESFVGFRGTRGSNM